MSQERSGNAADRPTPPRRQPMNQEEFDERFGLIAARRKTARGQLKKELKKNCAPCRSGSALLATIASFVPIVTWLPRYRWRTDLMHDVIGGLTVGIMHVPQGMAYGVLASLDPVYGLYTSFFPALFYMFFGTSRHNSLGVFAVVSLMVGSVRLRVLPDEISTTAMDLMNATTTISGVDRLQPITVVTSITLAVGLVQLAMALMRLDFLTAYLSDQVVAGFTTGAACHVFVAQLNKVLNVNLPRHTGFLRLYFMVEELVFALPEANLVTVAVSLCSMAFLVFGKELINPRVKTLIPVPIPFELILVIIGTAVSHFFNFKQHYHVKVVEAIPVGLPAPTLPRLDLVPLVIGDAIGIAIVIFVVTVSMGKLFAKRHGYRVDTRQELYALGFMECLCSLFSVYPASTALARSLVYEAAGTKTQLATIFSCGLLLIVIYLVGPLLYALPMCILAAIVIVALKGMFMQFTQLISLWSLSKMDFLVWLVSFLATFCYDVTEGLAISIAFALLTVVFRSQWARSHNLGKLPGTGDYRDLERYDHAAEVGGVRIFRFEGPLLFTNVERFKRSVHLLSGHAEL
uniref:STAS domain-containing protein n=1 Tax=Plectus sambesii TaxID=2011161 RepID=A0A914XGG2_9BILA